MTEHAAVVDAPAPGSARWLGFHLRLRAPHEAFLAQHLAPWLRREEEAGRVKRFFFIRYGSEGGELRLRLLPGPGAGRASLRAALDEVVGGYLRASPGAGGEPAVVEQPYSRKLHYFGETPESVYAELANEATSRLCLRIVGGPGGEKWTVRWLVLLSTLNQLLLGMARGDGAAFAARVEEGRAFARQGWESLGLSIVDDDALTVQPLLVAAAEAALARGAAAGDDPLVRHLVRLLRRVRRRGPGGGHVAVHALHLLCNKLGFTFYEEYNLFTALRRLAVPSVAARPAAHPAEAP
jgi:thiopeptide-type bacteriocin biosynthesis protein